MGSSLEMLKLMAASLDVPGRGRQELGQPAFLPVPQLSTAAERHRGQRKAERRVAGRQS